MYSFFQNFGDGIGCALNGIREFFSHRDLWKYAALPLLVVLLVYALLGGLGVWAVTVISAFLEKSAAELPSYLQWIPDLGNGVTAVMIFIFFWLIIVLSVGTLYELFGGLFFDRLIEKYSRDRAFLSLSTNSRRFEMQAVYDSCRYSLNTLFILLGTFFLNIMLPVVGPLLSFLLISYRLGVAYLAVAGFRYGRTLLITRQMAQCNCASTLGYGIMLYFLFTIPLAVLIFLPGLVTGSVLLYNLQSEKY